MYGRGSGAANCFEAPPGRLRPQGEHRRQDARVFWEGESGGAEGGGVSAFWFRADAAGGGLFLRASEVRTAPVDLVMRAKYPYLSAHRFFLRGESDSDRGNGDQW